MNVKNDSLFLGQRFILKGEPIEYIDDEKRFKMEEDDKDKYFYCLNYGNKIYEEDV